MLPCVPRIRTHPRTILLASALAAVTPAPHVLAASGAIDCPPTLHTMSVSPAIPGWQAVDTSPDPRPLESMAIRISPNDASGVPHSSLLRLEQGQRRTIQASWDLAEIRHNNAKLWLACVYSGTGIVLVRPLPAELSQCEFRVESTGDSLQESAGCR